MISYLADFFKYTTRPYGYEPLEGDSMLFIFLPPEIKNFLIIIFFACTIILSIYFYGYKGRPLKSSIFYGFSSAVVLTSLLFAVRSDYLWQRFINNISAKYDQYSTSEEKFLNLDALNHNTHNFLMTIKPYIKDSYKFIAPNFSSNLRRYLKPKAHFILPPMKMSEDARYLIVVDKYAHFDPEAGVLAIGNNRFSNLEMVFHYSKGAFVLRYKE